MRKLFRRTLKLLLVLALIAIIWNFRLIAYGIGQLNGQLKIILGSVPVEEVLQNPDTDNAYKKKLKLISEIRRFATDSLGLTDTDNYTTFYDQHQKPLMWVVTGCRPYSLEAKKWHFPVIGEVSYKGFFKEELAKEEAAKIRKEGFVSDIYSPSAWSTLGYFKDPILSGMLKRSPGRLAELIIHESTHATCYIESSVDFNENFATFTGEQGAAIFLKSKYGSDSEELRNYLNFLHDEKLYTTYMNKASKRLDSLYKSMPEHLSTKEKATMKFNFIAGILLEQNRLPFRAPEKYLFDFSRNSLPDNTEFMAFLRYRKNQDQFQKVFETLYQSDFRKFITDISAKAKRNEPLPFPVR